ncbi:hypothetical protein PS623_04626 [Pseudomonas fluorescens]|uniref:DNA cytosine methyltransferase n=1 Tax=Pseudomonas fluorescens TaxID=294 RepID=UPI001240F42E|nr:DNA cytosine methyltransferase [Pseudomonas fluorescens]VVN27816.1 hypothetical protein PS623_04626 [Pseudomonas fluorescens]
MTSALQQFPRDTLSEVIDFHTQYKLPLTAQDDEIIVDDFCGGGGGSTGLETGLGRMVALARNHNAAAISMHQANHPHAEHLPTDIFNGDPRDLVRGRRVGWYHLSPDCTHHSQARGGQPRDKETRNLSWIACKWAGRVLPRVISLENVQQILDWSPLIAKRDKATGRVVTLDLIPDPRRQGKLVHRIAEPGECVPVSNQFLIPDPSRKGETWKRFVKQLRGLGYRVEWQVLRACDYGAPTTRKRLFMIARCDGRRIVWPSPTHAKHPEPWQTQWRSAAECIDWSVASQSIFARAKPLAEATLRRIAKGCVKYVLDSADPFIVPIANWSSADSVQSIRAPLRTVTAWPKGGSFAMASPVFAPLTHQSQEGVCAPVTAREGELETFGSYLIQANGGKNTTAAHGMTDPVSTISTTGSQQQLATAHLVTLRKNCIGRSLSDALSTVTAGAEHHGLVEYTLSQEHEAGAVRVAAFLTQYYSTGGQWGSLQQPLNCITTKDRLALVTVVLSGTPYAIVDIKLRMLQPSELYAAQGFPGNYIIDRGHDGEPLTKTQQVRMCGNSVSPPVLAALAKANDPWVYEPSEALAA